MKIIIGIVSIMILGYALQFVLPWWSIALATIIVTYLLNKNYWVSFLVGFFAVFLLWGGFALIKDMANESLLSAQVGDLLQGLPSVALIALTGIIGGLIGGLSGLVGQSAREMI